jgi:phosphatidylglycerophosphate synthase
MRGRMIRWGALAVGIILFAVAVSYVNFTLAVGTIRRLGVALPLALCFSGLWHLARTWAWAWCFPQPRGVGFLRLARVRLAAEAFSYLTLRGIAGEPLKVVLLADRVTTRDATAAVALERIAYMIGTTLIVGMGSIAAIVGLPLTRIWFRVFRAFAIIAGVVGLLTWLVIRGRGTYVNSLLTGIDQQFGTTISRGRVASFVGAVEAQVLELVRGHPLRLAVLLVATVLSYLCMAFEAWVILRATGVPITANGAVAVETFSRVASFASAFIPANLGALEASSLAAVTAIGLGSGGAALALARRLRGLFWAGLGLAIYPRKISPEQPESDNTRDLPRGPRGATLLYLPHDSDIAVPPTARLAGLPILERVIRSAARANYGRIIVSTRDVPAETLSHLLRLSSAVDGVELISSDDAWSRAAETIGDSPVTLVGPGTVASPALLELATALTPGSGTMCDVPAGAAWRESGVFRLAAADAGDRDALAAALRRHRARAVSLPSGEDVSNGHAKLALRIVTRSDLAQAEATIRRASYKDTDNTLARFNRRMSLPISIALIRTPLTANQLSMLLVGLGFYAAWLFSLGHYWTGVLAAFLSLAASVLDGCDGEIARLKYQESALGCWIETFGDYSYYIAIFVGLTVGAVRQTQMDVFAWIGALALGGTLLSFAFLIYLRSRITAGRPERLHAIARERFKAEPTPWSRLIWRLSFTATRSAMPYGIAAFSLVYGLPAIVVLAAIGANVYWISLVLKLKHLLREDDAVIA